MAQWRNKTNVYTSKLYSIVPKKKKQEKKSVYNDENINKKVKI